MYRQLKRPYLNKESLDYLRGQFAVRIDDIRIYHIEKWPVRFRNLCVHERNNRIVTPSPRTHIEINYFIEQKVRTMFRIDDKCYSPWSMPHLNQKGVGMHSVKFRSVRSRLSTVA